VVRLNCLTENVPYNEEIYLCGGFKEVIHEEGWGATFWTRCDQMSSIVGCEGAAYASMSFQSLLTITQFDTA
jgi:hypothetical protein